MTHVDNFDLLNSPLEGTSLIEASAGTGKTYAIAGLFLRLILEKTFSVDEILVVTFTEAATEELKDRIRTRLVEAIEVCSTGTAKDAFLEALIQKVTDRAKALDRLKEAVRRFDEACIHTIHGFCRKILYENAFESSSLFDTELVTEQEQLKKEIVEDFWRIRFYGETPLFVNYAIQNKAGPKDLRALSGKSTAITRLKIIPEGHIPDASVQEEEFRKAASDVADNWSSSKAEVETILLTHKGLKRVHYRISNIPVWIERMDRWLSSDIRNPALFEGFEKFCTSALESAVKKNFVAPEHVFFYLCETLKEKKEALIQVFQKRLLGLKVALFHYLQRELEERKAHKNIQFFDDLLLNLHKALEGKGREALTKNIREKFKAALIDEFQDTDPVQYAIFKQIFNVRGHVLFLIGDPKQAIYGFRGADIFAYMDAAVHAQKRYTLKENWRSEPGLISAVNTIFENVPSPFVFDEIPFLPVSAASEKKDYAPLKTEDVSPEICLNLWLLDEQKIIGSGKPIPKSVAKELISKAVSSEIARLLLLGKAGKAMLGNRAIRENDMAVLVRENAEAHLMQQALSEVGVPSVLYTTDDLFASHEALEMGMVLTGIVWSEDETRLRALLSTDMFGLSGEDMIRLVEDEGGWEKWFIRINEYHRMWESHGFMRMFKALCTEQEILPRLMSFSDGERRCANLLHLSEVLHKAAVEGGLTMTGTVKWLKEKRNPDRQGEAEHQLRLESDENAVRLITIHRSKGLEYPIVFCPFTWAGARRRDSKAPVRFHDESDRRQSTLDLGSAQMAEHLRSQEKEALAENLRLLYVALTRARNRCYLVWGRFNMADTSALAYLFHHPDVSSKDNIVNHVSAKFMGLGRDTFLSDIKQVAQKSKGAINVSEMPVQGHGFTRPILDKKASLIPPKFSGEIDQQFRISSFSWLVSQHPMSAETADHDAVAITEGPKGVEAFTEEDPSGIFAFPKGTKAGTFMHDIFENMDFADKDRYHQQALVESKLLEHGFETSWNKTVCNMIDNVLAMALDGDRADFRLSRIQNQDRINELGFYFPLKFITPEKLARIFEKATGQGGVTEFPGQMERLAFSPACGYMKGFIDMVFRYQGKYYLVDWKSNYLGGRISDYDREGLDRAMKAHYYFLQYHIYCTALNQYLKVRLPGYDYERHFGGVFYIFLRGIDPKMGPDFGIYRDRPIREFTETLCRELIDI